MLWKSGWEAAKPAAVISQEGIVAGQKAYEICPGSRAAASRRRKMRLDHHRDLERPAHVIGGAAAQ